MIFTIMSIVVVGLCVAGLGWAARQSWQKMPVEPPAPTPFSRSQEANAEAARAWDARHPQVRQMRFQRRAHYPPRRRSIEE